MGIFMKEKFNISMIHVLVILFIISFFAYTYNFNKNHSYTVAEDTDIAATYVKGKVLEIVSEEIDEDRYYPGAYMGEQIVRFEILKGDYKGKIVEAKNYLQTTNYMYLEANDTVLVQITKLEDSDEVFFEIHQYYRQTGVYIMVGLFFLLVILVGRKKGVKTILSLCFAMYTIFFFTMPLIYHGKSPILISVLTVVVITLVTLYLLNGWSKKTFSAIISTALGVVSAGIVYVIFSGLLNITGYSTNEADSILLLYLEFGLQIKDLLFATILISSLGAVMDVGMSISSALSEMIDVKPDMSRKQLFESGMHIGQDMIGTMTNTLILAFTGGAFISMILLALSSMSLTRLFNSNYAVIEIIQGLAGTMAIVLTVPIASFVSAYLYTRKQEHLSISQNEEN